jgi:hypothetical protein
VQEKTQQLRFEQIVLPHLDAAYNLARWLTRNGHDAEDLVHSDELRWISFSSARYDFVQTPVLALPTPFRSFTHGIYCDEFAEGHTRDMIVRARLQPDRAVALNRSFQDYLRAFGELQKIVQPVLEELAKTDRK